MVVYSIVDEMKGRWRLQMSWAQNWINHSELQILIFYWPQFCKKVPMVLQELLVPADGQQLELIIRGTDKIAEVDRFWGIVLECFFVAGQKHEV